MNYAQSIIYQPLTQSLQTFILLKSHNKGSRITMSLQESVKEVADNYLRHLAEHSQSPLNHLLKPAPSQPAPAPAPAPATAPAPAPAPAHYTYILQTSKVDKQTRTRRASINSGACFFNTVG